MQLVSLCCSSSACKDKGQIPLTSTSVDLENEISNSFHLEISEVEQNAICFGREEVVTDSLPILKKTVGGKVTPGTVLK